MKKIIKAGATSQTIDLFIQDSASTTGAGKTGLAYNTASLTAYYRKGATGSATVINLATQTVGGAYSSAGFVEIDATNMPGMYRLDLPNAVVDTAGSVSLLLKGASGMAPLPVELQVTSTDLEGGVMPTITTYTGNTVQTGDSFARLGAPAGASTAADIAAIQAKTTNLPASPASTTNITAGTITTVTNLTNLPAITADWLTAAGTASDFGTEIGTAVWASAARTLTASTNFNDISTANVLTQVNAAIDTAISELGVAAPTATPTLRTGLMLLYMALRNKLVVQTSGTDALEIYNDAGTKITSKLLTDTGGDYTEAKAT